MSCRALLFLVALVVQVVYSIIANFEYTSTGVNTNYVVTQHGMSDVGHIEINYVVAAVNPGFPSTFPLLLVIINEGQREGYYSTSGNNCNKPSLYRQMLYPGQGNITYQPTTADQYSILLLQCRNSNPLSPVKANIEAILKNPYPSSPGWQYLPIDEVTYVVVLEGLLIAYLVMFAALSCQVYFAWRFTKRVHLLFGAVLLLQIFYVIARYNEYRNLNDSGKSSVSYEYFSQLTGHFASFANLSVLLMLSLGWSILRWFIAEWERQVIFVSLSIYFIIGLAAAACSHQDYCDALALTTYALKYVLYLIIVVAMNLTVVQLRSLLYHTPWTPGLTYQYARTKQFSLFRISFILYLLLPTAFLLIDALVFSWKETWLTYTFTDLMDLCLIFHIGATFGPVNEWLLLRPFGGVRSLQG